MTDTTEHPTPKVPWSQVLKAENENWDWDELIKQQAGQPSIERRYALRRYFGLWDDLGLQYQSASLRCTAVRSGSSHNLAKARPSPSRSL